MALILKNSRALKESSLHSVKDSLKCYSLDVLKRFKGVIAHEMNTIFLIADADIDMNDRLVISASDLNADAVSHYELLPAC